MRQRSLYQTFWDYLHKKRHQRAARGYRKLVQSVHHATFFLIGHGVCVLAYVLPKQWAFQAASRLTCNKFHANEAAFYKSRITFLGAGVITMATVSTGGLEMITDRVLSIFDPTHSLRISETWDGNDYEVSISGFGKGVRTDNYVDDTNLVASGAVATWQQLSDNGWELMLWTPQDPHPAQMTNDVYDDVNPRTDGRFIAWQKKVDGQWAIYYLDVQESSRATKISGEGNASDMHMEDGVVVWQEWIDENWEIMMYRIGQGPRRITYNNTGDISPVIDAGVIFWEGIDPEGGDKDIFRYNVQTGVMGLETQNDRDDDAPTLVEDNVIWFERGDVSQRVVHDDEDDRTTKTQLPPLPVILPPQVEQAVEAEAGGESGSAEVEESTTESAEASQEELTEETTETTETTEETTQEETQENEQAEASEEVVEEEVVSEETVEDTTDEQEQTTEDVSEETPQAEPELEEEVSETTEESTELEEEVVDEVLEEEVVEEVTEPVVEEEPTTEESVTEEDV